MKIAPSAHIRKKIIRDVSNYNPDAQPVPDDKQSLEIKTETLEQCGILTKDDTKVDVEAVPNEADKVVNTSSSSSSAIAVNTTSEQVVDPPKSQLMTITESIVTLPVADDNKTDKTVSDNLQVDLVASKVNTVEKINDTLKSPEKLPPQPPVKENIFERPKSPVKEFKESLKSSTVPKIIDQSK